METARMPENKGTVTYDTPKATKASRAPSSGKTVRMTMPIRHGSKKNLIQKSGTPEAPTVVSDHKARATSAPPAALNKGAHAQEPPIDLLVARDLDAHAEDEAFAAHEAGLPEGYVHPQVGPSNEPAVDPTIKADLDAHAEDEISSVRILKARLAGPPEGYVEPGPTDDATVYPRLYNSNPTTQTLPTLISAAPAVGDFVALYRGDKLVGALVLAKEGGYVKIKYFNDKKTDWVVAQSTNLYVAGSPRWGNKPGRVTGRKRKLGPSSKKLKQMILGYYAKMLDSESNTAKKAVGLMQGLRHLKVVAPTQDTADFKQKAPKRFKASSSDAMEVDLPDRPVVGEIVMLARNSKKNAEALVTASEGGYIKVKFTEDCFENWVVADSVSRPSMRNPPVKASDGKLYRQLKISDMWKIQPAGGPRSNRSGNMDTGTEGSSSSSSTTNVAAVLRMKATEKALYMVSSEMLLAATFGAFLAWAANRVFGLS